MAPKIFHMAFSKIYPLLLQKVEKKGRSKLELDTAITWLTGYDDDALLNAIETHQDFETFFANAPALNPNRKNITGVVCGIRVEAIEDPLMQNIRYLDKMVDELARGKALNAVLRD